MLTNLEEGIWTTGETSLLETCKLRVYLIEMLDLYKKAYQYQQKQNQYLEEYIKKNQISKEELERIEKEEKQRKSRMSQQPQTQP